MICFVLGTRPEIIKLSPIIKKLLPSEYFVIHTGQHYSYNMDKLFFKELGLLKPKYRLRGIKSNHHGEMVGRMMAMIELILIKENPKWVVVQGDTNSVLAGALAAAKLNIKVAHVEAGLRSYDRKMPEETNRVIVDHISDLHFTPTLKSLNNLIREGINPFGVFEVGNTIVDAVKEYAMDYRYDGSYILLTIHRQENTTKENLTKIISIVKMLQFTLKTDVIFPIHPRTKKLLKQYKIDEGEIELIDPVGFTGFLRLQQSASLIITDSGGVQEEACILGTPCVTLRTTTERPETIEVGSNMLCDLDSINLQVTALRMIVRTGWVNPFGDGKASERIVKELTK